MKNRILIFAALAAFFAFAGSVGAATVDCTSQATRDRMAQIVKEGSQKPNQEYIKDVQQCLVDHKCYVDAKFAGQEVDGYIEGRTQAALTQCIPHSAAPQQDCGDGQMSSYVLTSTDLKNMKDEQTKLKADLQSAIDKWTAAQADDTTWSQSGNQQKPQPPKPVMSDGLFAALNGVLQNAEYPSRDLFENALNYFITDQKVDPAELNRFRPDLLARACKAHASSDPAAKWDAKSDVLMVNPLSQTLYGFYPFWQNSPPPPSSGDPDAKAPTASVNIDFSLLSRVGWFGVTFSDGGSLVLPTVIRNGDAEKQIEISRRFRTSVDLVLYRKGAAGWWKQLFSQDVFMDRLSSGIANEVGAELPGFLNKWQKHLLIPALTMAPTAWDGVTLYFDGFPYDDAAALKNLASFITQLRMKLGQHEIWLKFRKSIEHNLDLNVVVPFEYLVTKEPGSGSSSPYRDTCSAAIEEAVADGAGSEAQAPDNKTISALAALVPKSREEVEAFQPGTPKDDLVDRFIVFLPQCTSPNKKLLRLAVENAFNRTMTVDLALESDPHASIGMWRYEMLRKITYVLFPGTWNWIGDDYKKAGSQFYDDMIYALDNFWGVGFWPLPEYGANKGKMADDIRSIFRVPDANAFDRYLTPAAIDVTGIAFANNVGAWRREIALFIEVLLLPLVIYGILAAIFVELRQFYAAHRWWFWGLGLFILAVMFMLVLFDRRLNPVATTFVIVVVLFGIGWFLAQQYIRSRTERDLP